MKKVIIFFIILTLPVIVFPQEYLSGLTSNPVIKSHQKATDKTFLFKSYVEEYEPIDLPFYDDFSEISVYPDTNKWINNEVYINADFAVYPVNYGVATFDVLDANGDIYPEASPFPFIADRLTSYPVRLDSIINEDYKITPADSIYLSFYYQPQGRGDNPLAYDSLVLDFGLYNGDTIFSHIDSVLVYGADYPAIFDYGYFPPFTKIFSPFGCDTSMFLILQDTLFPEDAIMVPCDSAFVLDTEWIPIWGVEGDSIDVFVEENDTYFKQVMIPITDTTWLKKDFQFRFLNYASLSDIVSWQSNTDHWHIDMVYLNINRSVDDLYFRDVSFSETPHSLIKDLSSMPFWQYSGNPVNLMTDSIDVYIHNLDSVSHTCSYTYFVLDENDEIVDFNYPGYTDNLIPYKDINTYDYQPFVKPAIKSFFVSTESDSVEFKINHVVYDEDDITVGDTIVFVQEFNNYFAYDDGTAEAGYGLTPAGARLAYKFQTEKADTLRGIQMFFNKTRNNENDDYFHICLWNDNNGRPGNRIELGSVKPKFTNSLNKFDTYLFEDIITLGRQVFYIGWEQTSNDNLNLGFDRNNNSRDKIFYNVGNGWVNSSFEGSLMIRPIVGPALLDSLPIEKSLAANLEINPNPPNVDGIIKLVLPTGYSSSELYQFLTIRIFDISGRQVYTEPYSDSINVSLLEKGLYILNLYDSANSRNYTAKLMIVK